ncbi:hypothetical protein Tco_0711224 [Tanacetum coccineum]
MGFPVGSIVWALEARIGVAMDHSSWVQVLLHDIHAKGITLSETFQVVAIIKKLPLSWVEFKNYLKYKRKEMSVEDLHVGSSSKSNSKGKGKDKRKNEKKRKGKAECLSPKARIMPKRVTPRHANMVNNNMDMIAMMSDVIAMISEVNMERISKSKRAKTSKKPTRNEETSDHEERYQSRISPTQGKSQIKSKEVKVMKSQVKV